MLNLHSLCKTGVFLLLICTIVSCGSFKKQILFRTTDTKPTPEFQRQIAEAEKKYQIKPSDLLDISVFTNKGESLIDPVKVLDIAGGNINAWVASGTGGAGTATTSSNTYVVSPEGTVNLPMIGSVKLEGLNLTQTDSVLQGLYNKFYQETFVVTKLLNKRVIFLGAGGGKVIPLTHPGMNLIEALAIAGFGGSGGGGAKQVANATNIRLIRGDLRNPGVIVVDLSNIQGLMEHDLSLQHGDIIYVEPIVRPFAETVAEFNPVFTLVAQLVTLYFIFDRFNQ